MFADLPTLMRHNPFRVLTMTLNQHRITTRTMDVNASHRQPQKVVLYIKFNHSEHQQRLYDLIYVYVYTVLSKILVFKLHWTQSAQTLWQRQLL